MSNILAAYKALPPEKMAELLHYFRKVMFHRAKQWDSELRMEAILDTDVEMDVPAYAGMLDTPVSWSSAEKALTESMMLLALGEDDTEARKGPRLTSPDIMDARPLQSFTAFCIEQKGTGTIWIEPIQAEDLESAMKVAVATCAEAWESEPERIHLLGISRGDIEILHWEDIHNYGAPLAA